MSSKGSISTLLLLFCLVPALAVAQGYTIVDLGTLSPTGINTWGQVAANNNGHAFVWAAFGGARDLGVLHGGTFASAAAINDVGMITGTADGRGTVASSPNLKCPSLTQPFIWTWSNGMRGLGTVGLPGGFMDIWCNIPFFATGIDHRGQVVGYHPDVETYEDGFLWTKADGMTLLPDGYENVANGINNRGDMVGSYLLPFLELDRMSHAVLWNDQVLTDLGTLGGADADFLFCSSGNAVNDLSQVVGWSTTSEMSFPCSSVLSGENVLHAFLWTSSSGMRDLGTLPGDTLSAASKINFYGQVIGSSGNVVISQSGQLGGELIQVSGHPFVWSERYGMQDLNTLIPINSGWVLNSATDINIWGQIVGTGTHHGQTHGFLLTPLKLLP
jgi:uncharacterized membrane protein